MNVTEQAIVFAKKLFHVYLEERDFEKFRLMLGETVSWIGAGAHEIAKNHTEVGLLLGAEESFRSVRFEILEQRLEADPFNAEIVMVSGELTMKVDKDVSILPEINLRFSIVCKLLNNEFKVIHIHFSVLDSGQMANQFVAKSEVHGRSIMQEEFLRKNEKVDDELAASETRYEIAIKHTGVVIFDYLIESKQIVQPPVVTEKFGIPCVVNGAAASPLWKKVVHPSSLKDFQDIYKRIDNGEPAVRATILFIDVSNQEVINEIFLTNVFNHAGKPVRAVGLMTDVTQTMQLERERRYQQAMNHNKTQSYDANITQNLITNISSEWLEGLAIPHFEAFSDMAEYVASNMVAPDQLEAFEKFFDRESISAAFHNNQTQRILQYRRRGKNGCYDWAQSTMNVICDDITQDIKVRCYTEIITEQKEKERRIAEEQRFYELMMTKSIFAYEVNVTKDMFLHGHEKWEASFGIQVTGSYTSILADFAAEALHPHDIAGFSKIFLRENVLRSYYAGQGELYCEYRRKDEKGRMMWVSCTMHMMEDTATGDVLSFSYVLNINAEKVKKLELVYKAEHDTLTGLYNKGITENQIEKCLKEDGLKPMQHAFFMLDIDRFKQINDNLGHAFGDGVLSQAARKIKDLFREDDIIGRIGGDEFVVLVKNITSHARAVAKAKQLCEVMREVYVKDDKQYHVSVSVGIALYGEHGVTYKDLHKHADVALYAAKKNGRDQCRVYDKTMIVAESTIKNIDVNDLIEVKSFEKNVVEYVFRILYESSNKVSCINSVLDLVGKQYNVSRAYIFEDTQDGLATTNTFEWCNIDIKPFKDRLENFVYGSKLGNYQSRFNDQGIFYMADARTAPQNIRKILEPQKIKSMLHFAIIKDDKVRGFVGFDQCNASKVPSKAEITELRSISNILGVFLLEMRSAAMIEATKNAAISIVDSLDSYAYVIDKASHKLLFVNERTKKISSKARAGELCHKTLWDRSTPCENCPMKNLEGRKDNKLSKDMYNPQFNVWVKATASWINWIDGRRVCLVESVDITEYKQ